MAIRSAPTVRLYQNPWSNTLSDGVLLQFLKTAAINADEQLLAWDRAGSIEEGRDSYACILLDPTRPRWQQTATDRLMAAVLLGPDAERFLPNGLAKADAHDRHGVPNGFLVRHASYALGNGEFAYGDSAEHLTDGAEDNNSDFLIAPAVAGGSGLSVVQDGVLALNIVTEVMQKVRRERDRWLDEQRKLKGDAGHRWFNQDDEPANAYAAILRSVPIASA